MDLLHLSNWCITSNTMQNESQREPLDSGFYANQHYESLLLWDIHCLCHWEEININSGSTFVEKKKRFLASIVLKCGTWQAVVLLHYHKYINGCYILIFFLAEIREAFKVLDRDGNGFISKQELGMAMRSLGYMPSEVELAIIMQRLDMDGESHTCTQTLSFKWV